MSFEQPKFEQSISDKAEKEIIWEQKLKEIEGTTDSLGFKIDEGIKETSVAFNVLGLPTSASCEGHIDHGISAPWVILEVPNRPEERFVGENEIYQRVADKYGISLEEVKRGLNFKAWQEARREASEKGETGEYQKWREENKKLTEKASKLLEEFYYDKKAPPDIKIEISESDDGNFTVHNGGEDYRPVPENLSEEEKKGLLKRLRTYQEEMSRFGAFIKEKYFSN